MFNNIIGKIKGRIRKKNFRKAWREQNTHNTTYVETFFDISRVKVGYNTYGPLHIISFGSGNCNLEIGSYCSIAHDVKFMLGGEHSYRSISTYPFRNNIMKEQRDTYSKGNIIVADDVWIGQEAMILSGVTIGQGAVIAARSVVVKDVPPYAVVGGNPAKIIKYRCSQERISELLKCDYSKLKDYMIREHEQDLYGDIEKADLSWFPKK